MAVKLLVSNEVDAKDPDEYRFEQDHVTIGRSSENLLTLPDPKRVVSKQHAEIRSENGVYQLVDRGSKNFTYLNGKRLRSGRPYDLQSGDTFEIGDFEVEFVIAEDQGSTEDETVFAQSFVNPFDDPVSELSSALIDIVEAYDDVPANQRFDALQDAFTQTEEVASDHEAVALVGRLLGLKNGETPADTESTAIPGQTQEKEREDDTAVAGRRPSAETGPSIAASGDRRDALYKVLLESVARAVRIPWQFRHEFIGQTIVQSSDREALYEGDADALEGYLAESGLTEEESEERLQALQGAVDKLLTHQMALLDGYKAGVQNGARQLLDEMNPEEKGKAVREDNQLYDLFPLFSQKAVVEELQTTYQELQDENWSVAERRIFRPAFIKAYLARMTAAPEAQEADL